MCVKEGRERSQREQGKESAGTKRRSKSKERSGEKECENNMSREKKRIREGK
jgi:hypothetical protein